MRRMIYCITALFVLLLCSCEKLSLPQQESILDSSNKHSVTIATRSTQDAVLNMPVSIYAIKGGTATDSTKINSKEDKWTLNVGDGQWIFAAKSAWPYYYGSKQMDIDDDAETSIIMSPAIAKVKIALKGIDASSVSVELSNLYSKLNANGSYSGTTQHIIGLAKNDTAWVGEDYVMPSRGKLQMYITYNDTTFLYTHNDGLQAGYKYTLIGNYSAGHKIDGFILVGDWLGEKVVYFMFGATEGERADSVVNGSDLTLSSKVWDNVPSAYSETPNAAIEIANNYTEDGHSDWRIPTKDEARLIRSANPQAGASDRYLCEDGTYTFTFDPSGNITKAGSKTGYKLVLVR